MSILVRYHPANLTTEKYDEAIRQLEEAGDFPPDGLEYHVLFESEGGLRISEIWDSREQWEMYGPRLLPVLANVGIEYSADPEILKVHKIVKR